MELPVLLPPAIKVLHLFLPCGHLSSRFQLTKRHTSLRPALRMYRFIHLYSGSSQDNRRKQVTKENSNPYVEHASREIRRRQIGRRLVAGSSCTLWPKKQTNCRPLHHPKYPACMFTK